MSEQLISIIVPVYNEAPNIPILHRELVRHTKELPYQFEMLFVDDGSTDTSAKAIRSCAKRDRRVRLLPLSRNFGKEAAMTAGLHAAQGDAAIIMDADLQMPPRLIGKFIEHWKNGAEVVVGVFSRRSMSRLHTWGSHLFYRIMRAIALTTITPHATDYRLLDRQVINVFNKFTERNRITRGLIDWLGFQRTYVYFEQAPREHGQPTYNFRKLLALAVNSFTSYSMMPLRLAGYLGAFILALGVPLGMFLATERFVFHDPFHWGVNGTTMLAVLTLCLVGVTLTCLGLISLYIAHIHDEVTNRPLYILRQNAAKDIKEMTEEVTETAETAEPQPARSNANVAQEAAEA